MNAGMLGSGCDQEVPRNAGRPDVKQNLSRITVGDPLHSAFTGESVYLFTENGDFGCRQHNSLSRSDELTQFGAVFLQHLFYVLSEDVDVFRELDEGGFGQ